MTLIKSILLGSAAGIVAVAGAQAADLPTRKAAPAADYVKICNVNGTAGFIIPGSDTCLKLFGDVKLEVIGASTSDAYIPGVALLRNAAGVPIRRDGFFVAIPTQTTVNKGLRDNFEMGAREDLGFDASSNTAYGPLVAEAQFEGNQRNGGANGSSIPGTFGTGFAMDHAFITWAGLKVGYFEPYDIGNGPGDLDYFSPDPGTTEAVEYTATFGGGFSASVYARDSVSARTNGTINALISANNNVTGNTVVTPFTNTYHGLQYPDFGAELAVAQGWGKAVVDVMAHNTDIIQGPFGLGVSSVSGRPISYGGTNFWGYGVNGLVSVNIPSLGPKSEFTIQGAYSHGALSLGGVTAPGVIPFNGNGASFYFNDAAQSILGGFVEPNSWSVASHLLFQLNPQFSISPEIAYGSINYGSNLNYISDSLYSWMGGFITHWDPVENLDFQLDLIYVDTHQARPFALPNAAFWQTQSNGFFGRIQVARTF